MRNWFLALMVALCIAYKSLGFTLSLAECPQYAAADQSQTDANGSGPTNQVKHDSFWVRAVDDPINLFTGLLAVFTVVLAGASIWQGRLTQRSIRVAERALTDLERPYVYIGADNVMIDDAQGRSCAKYTFTNHGRSAATIESINFSIGISTNGQPLVTSEVAFDDPIWDRRIIAPTNFGSSWLRCPADFPHTRNAGGAVVPTLMDPQQVFLWVVVRYRGPFTQGHETSACWRHGDRNRFWEWGGEQYNYVK